MGNCLCAYWQQHESHDFEIISNPSKAYAVGARGYSHLLKIIINRFKSHFDCYCSVIKRRSKIINSASAYTYGLGSWTFDAAVAWTFYRRIMSSALPLIVLGHVYLLAPAANTTPAGINPTKSPSTPNVYQLLGPLPEANRQISYTWVILSFYYTFHINQYSPCFPLSIDILLRSALTSFTIKQQIGTRLSLLAEKKVVALPWLIPKLSQKLSLNCSPWQDHISTPPTLSLHGLAFTTFTVVKVVTKPSIISTWKMLDSTDGKMAKEAVLAHTVESYSKMVYWILPHAVGDTLSFANCPKSTRTWSSKRRVRSQRHKAWELMFIS